MPTIDPACASPSMLRMATASDDLTFSHLRSERPRLRRAADRIAHQIALELVEQPQIAGRRLPPEHELMAELGCSRQALRSALRLLEGWGLIAMKMGRVGGPVSRLPEPGDFVDQLAVLLEWEGGTFRDVLLARGAIDPMIAEAAARNATEEQLDELEQLLVEIEDSANLTPNEFQAAILRLTILIGEAAGLVLLAFFLDTLTLFADEWIMPRLPFDDERRHRVALGYKAVVRAIRQRNPTEARKTSARQRDESLQHWGKQCPDLIDMPMTRFTSGSLDPKALLPSAE